MPYRRQFTYNRRPMLQPEHYWKVLVGLFFGLAAFLKIFSSPENRMRTHARINDYPRVENPPLIQSPTHLAYRSARMQREAGVHPAPREHYEYAIKHSFHTRRSRHQR